MLFMEKAGPMSIGEFIAQCRKDLGYSQAELAKKLFISPQAISNLERNSSSLALDTALSICKEFGLTLEALQQRDASKKGQVPPLDEQVLARRLVALRQEKNLGRAEVASLFGVSERTVRNYETGASLPSFQFLEFASDLYEAPFEAFFFEPSPPKTEEHSKKTKARPAFFLPVGAWVAIAAIIVAAAAGGVTAGVFVSNAKNRGNPLPIVSSTTDSSLMASDTSAEEESSFIDSAPLPQVGEVHYDVSADSLDACYLDEYGYPLLSVGSFRETSGDFRGLNLYCTEAQLRAGNTTNQPVWDKETLLLRSKKDQSSSGGEVHPCYMAITAEKPFHAASFTFMPWNRDRCHLSIEYSLDGESWIADSGDQFDYNPTSTEEVINEYQTIELKDSVTIRQIRLALTVHPSVSTSNMYPARIGVFSFDLTFSE